jgi:hypothetical protein
MHFERNGYHRWFPVGIIIVGLADFDLIRIRRVNAVRLDGTIILVT